MTREHNIGLASIIFQHSNSKLLNHLCFNISSNYPQKNGGISTEILAAGVFYYAEDYQQYLAKKPYGYCDLGGMGWRFYNEHACKKKLIVNT